MISLLTTQIKITVFLLQQTIFNLRHKSAVTPSNITSLKTHWRQNIWKMKWHLFIHENRFEPALGFELHCSTHFSSVYNIHVTHQTSCGFCDTRHDDHPCFTSTQQSWAAHSSAAAPFRTQNNLLLSLTTRRIISASILWGKSATCRARVPRFNRVSRLQVKRWSNGGIMAELTGRRRSDESRHDEPYNYLSPRVCVCVCVCVSVTHVGLRLTIIFILDLLLSL